MSGSCILALDQGTTSSRAIAFDKGGRPIHIARREFTQHYPKAGWVEHDPVEIWESQRAVMKQAIEGKGMARSEIAAVGIANQRETTVVWDRKTGAPIYNAIVWQDRRTANRCQKMKADGREKIVRERTGMLIDPYFAGTKLQWILENIDGAKAKAENGELLFGTIDSWLVWNLTGGKRHVTDASNASRTLLYNIHTLEWDEELLEILGVPRSMLPEVCSSSEVYGTVADGLPLAGKPIAGMAGDQQAALFGQACFSPGMAKNTYGTGCFLLMQTGREPVESKHNLLTTIAWQIGGITEYALEGSIFMGGAVVQWLRDELRIIGSASECDTLAETVPDSNGLFIVPAFAGLGAPHWDSFARGSAFGMTRGTNRAHFCRAALEAIAFQSADLIRCMEKDSGISLKELRVDGGATRSHPLMQFQADLLGSTVIRPEVTETTALGAACLAGLAIGFWGGKDDILQHWKEGTRFVPRRDEAEMKQLSRRWDRAVERTKSWLEADEEG